MRRDVGRPGNRWWDGTLCLGPSIGALTQAHYCFCVQSAVHCKGCKDALCIGNRSSFTLTQLPLQSNHDHSASSIQSLNTNFATFAQVPPRLCMPYLLCPLLHRIPPAILPLTPSLHVPYASAYTSLSVLCGLSPGTNYTDRTTDACRRS
jgi:hypothetical protein